MCVVTPPSACALPGGAQSAAQAREFVREQRCREHTGEIAFEAVLLASELVTHALTGGARPTALALDCHAARIELALHAVSVRRRRVRFEEQPPIRAFLLELMAPDWGVTVDAGRRTYWCVLTTGALLGHEVTP